MSNVKGSPVIGFLNILTTVFIILKLTGVVDCSWWFVTAPFWVPIVILILFKGVL